MVNVRAIDFDQTLQEIVEAAEDKPQPLDIERANAHPIERMVPQPSPAPSPSASGQESSRANGDKVYQGDVQVSVDAHGEVKQMMRFMNQLNSNNELQLRQLLGTYATATLWLALRRPLRLRDVFSKMESVSEVATRPDRTSKGWTPTLHVVLKRDPVLQGPRIIRTNRLTRFGLLADAARGLETENGR